MPLIDDSQPHDDHDDHHRYAQQHRQRASGRRQSQFSSLKQNSSDDHTSTAFVDDEDDDPGLAAHELKSVTTSVNHARQGATLRYSTRGPLPTSRSVPMKTTAMSVPKWNSSLSTRRSLAVVPSIGRRAVQGVLVRFFRNGDEHHRGVKMAINESDLKSWEAFLNYLNSQPKLQSSAGGIRHVYSLRGEEIRSIHQFQHRKSYVVSSGSFMRTHFRYNSESFTEEIDANQAQNPVPYWSTRTPVRPQWRSPVVQTEHLFVLPYSQLHMYESLIFNRHVNITFDEWLVDQVTELLSYYTNGEEITRLFAITEYAFVDVRSFSKLFHLLKETDTFIACTDDDYVHAKHQLINLTPNDLFTDRLRPRPAIDDHPPEPQPQEYPTARAIEDVKLSLSWIHGYNGQNDLTKKLYPLPDNEILYVIDCIGVIYETQLKQQRFYIEHKNCITSVNVHQSQPLVASSEIGSSSSNQRAVIHIWDHAQLRTVTEIRKEQFGSYVSLLLFSPKEDDNLLLVVSRDRPRIVFFLDWKRNELLYSIRCKSDPIMSILFAFDTTEWIACVSQQHLLFYRINWNVRPLHMLERRESEVQNIYTGAAACESAGDRLLVGDKVGSVHVWRLIDNEPKLVTVQENVLENDIDMIVCISEDAFLLANGRNQMKTWNLKANKLELIEIQESMGFIQSICCIRRESAPVALAIGTRFNYILMKPMKNDQFDVVVRGQTSASMGLCFSTDGQHFFSIGADRHVYKWNSQNRTIEWSTKSTQPLSCADLHPERNIIVLGTETSKLLIYDTLSSFYIATVTLKVTTGVKSVRFSPDGSMLAVGLQNGSVFIFDVIGNGDFHQHTDGVLENESLSVTNVMWSVDSKHLLAVYSDNDYNIWSLPSLEMVRGQNIRAITWHQALHPMMCDILDKSAIDTHNSAIVLSPSLVLCCGKDGQLRLFRNSYERNSQTYQFGLGPVHSILPSTTKNTFLLSMTDHPVLAEIQVTINSHFL